ncbi:C-type lectin-like [Trinorchestia longiramus]|nr:C-type lectin-like [Trinorchestia longiramus]
MSRFETKSFDGYIKICTTSPPAVFIQSVGESHRCDLPLGLESGHIPEAAITTSLRGSSVTGIRLNSNGAWCYNLSSLESGQQITLTVDLGRVAFVSAVQTQGPPASVQGPEYVNYNPFRLYNSTSTPVNGSLPDELWDPCCGDTKTFHAEDKHAEIDVISTHAFGQLVLARTLKLEFETGLNTGDRKCYRLEVLGCPQELTPSTNLSIAAIPSGYLQTTWYASTVVLPTVTGTDVYPLNTLEYEVKIERWGTSLPNTTTVQHVVVPRVLLPNPVWGAQYQVQMTCIHQGVALPCGTAQITALLQGCSKCPPGEELVFRRPQPLRGSVVQEGAATLQGALVLWWDEEGSGWITPKVTLTVKNNAMQLVAIQTFDSGTTRAIVEGLQEGETYTVEFIPVTKLKDQPIFTYPLYLIQWETVLEASPDSGFGAFLADLSLEANVLWNGTLRVTWTPGIVRGTMELPATSSSTTSSSTTSSISSSSTATVQSSTNPDSSSSELGSSSTSAGTNSTSALLETSSATNTSYIFTSGSSPSSNNASSTNSSVISTTAALSSAGTSASSVSTPGVVTTRAPPSAITTAQATSYNITLLRDQEVVAYAVMLNNASELAVDFPLLSLQEEYTVEMKCFLGSLEVNCSNTKAVTGLPLSWGKVDGVLKVYVGQDPGAGWYEQKEKCSRSSSQLVTLATSKEEALFMDAMKLKNIKTYNEFWLGSCFCKDNGGKLWEDGSPWAFSRLPIINSGISSSTCCVKVIKTSVEGEPYAYKWRGEQCGSILPAVCEHTPPGGCSSVSTPRLRDPNTRYFHTVGLVGEIKSMNRSFANTTSASVRFDYIPRYWQASYIVVTFVPTLDLATDTPILNQTEVVVMAAHNSSRTVPRDLLKFTEYAVTAKAVLVPLSYSGPEANTTVRTYPDEPVMARILKTGRVAYKWAQKIAEFGENDTISVRLRGGLSSAPDTSMPETELSGRAGGGSIGPLKIGRQYHLQLQESDAGNNMSRRETVDFTAYPPCDCTECQQDQQCYVVSRNKVPALGSQGSCDAVGAAVVQTTYRKTLNFLLNIAQAIGDDLWVSMESQLGTGIDEKAVQTRAFASLEEDAEMVTTNTSSSTTTSTTTTQRPTSADGLCRLVSRAVKEVIKRPCMELHFTACAYQAKIAPIFPPTNEIAVQTGESWVKINWNASVSGWSANYSVEYHRTRGYRYKRQILDQNFLAPPVTIEGLQANTPYTMTLMASLGDGYDSSSPPFQVITGKQTSGYFQPLGMAGAGWAQSGDVFLLQLLASSLLVTACIGTMLLFFSTGMFYQDCMAQLGFLTSLLIAYLLLILAHSTVVVKYDEKGCAVLAVALHMVFLAAFMFLTLESHAISFLLVSRINNPFQKTNWLMVLVGTFTPVIYCLITGGIINTHYAEIYNQNCWLDPTGPAVYVEALPKVVLAVATMVLLVMTFTTKSELPELVELENLRGRQSDGRKLRWVIGAEMLLLFTAWCCGVSAYHTKYEALYVVFAVTTLLLAIVILFCRTYFDETFRSKWHRLCCGTELTYKRSDLVGLSARNRISPHHLDPSPLDESLSPLDESLSPLYELSSPLDESLSPLYELSSPLDESLSPLYELSSPFGELSSPFGELLFTLGARAVKAPQLKPWTTHFPTRLPNLTTGRSSSGGRITSTSRLTTSTSRSTTSASRSTTSASRSTISASTSTISASRSTISASRSTISASRSTTSVSRSTISASRSTTSTSRSTTSTSRSTTSTSRSTTSSSRSTTSTNRSATARKVNVRTKLNGECSFLNEVL